MAAENEKYITKLAGLRARLQEREDSPLVEAIYFEVFLDELHDLTLSVPDSARSDRSSRERGAAKIGILSPDDVPDYESPDDTLRLMSLRPV